MSIIFDANRLIQIARSAQFLLARPLLGYGVGNAATVLGFGRDENGLGTIDNYYLTVALETGFSGLLVFLLIAGWFVVGFFRSERRWRSLYFTLIVVFVNLLTLSVVELHPLIYMLFALLLVLDGGGQAARRSCEQKGGGNG